MAVIYKAVPENEKSFSKLFLKIKIISQTAPEYNFLYPWIKYYGNCKFLSSNQRLTNKSSSDKTVAPRLKESFVNFSFFLADEITNISVDASGDKFNLVGFYQFYNIASFRSICGSRSEGWFFSVGGARKAHGTSCFVSYN